MKTKSLNQSNPLPKELGELRREQCCKPSNESLDRDSELSETEFNILRRFLDDAARHTGRLLYRGQRRDTLGGLLCADPNAPIAKIACGLFFFGEKGKHFWKQEFRGRIENSKWPQILKNLADLSPESFGQILVEFDKILCVFGDEPWVKDFEGDHPELCDAVRTNRKGLVEKFRQLDQDCKRLVRNGYVYALHTYSRHKYKAYLPLVSTSPKYRDAVWYAGKPQTNGPDDNACVICAFLPKRFDQTPYVISVQSLIDQVESFRKLGFPPIRSGFFKQKEIAFWGGIFPHCIYGLYQPAQARLCCNPAVLDEMHNRESTIWRDGLLIEQSAFDQRARKETAYASAIDFLPKVLNEFCL